MIRTILTTMLSELPDIEVIGHATNGEEAVRMTLRLKPDLLTMDIRMPVMDGLEATRHILRVRPTPIVVVANSVYAADYNIAFNALEIGALTVIEKPHGLASKDYDTVRDQLIDAVRVMAGIKVLSRKETSFTSSNIGPMTAMLQSLITQPIQVIAIAASTGGPAILKYLFSNLPGDFSIPIVIVQHMLDAFVPGLADWLSSSGHLPVKMAQDRERLTPGKVFLSPGSAHLIANPGGVLRVDLSPPYKGYRPSANLLFKSVAETYGKNAVGIILTGMGDDGVEGLQALGRTGAHIIAQGQESSAVFGMPKMAIEGGAVDEILSPASIVSRLIKLHNHMRSINK